MLKNPASMIAYIASVVLCAAVLIYLAVVDKPSEQVQVVTQEVAVTHQEEEAPLLIDINTATAEELELLPDIGPKIASDILAYRRVSGGFSTIEQIMEVEGVGEKRFEAIKDMITVGGKNEDFGRR